MKHIPRHAINIERAREGASNSERVLKKVTAAAPSRAALSVLLSVAKSYVGELAALDPKPAKLMRALRLGAQSAAAIFALGCETTGEVEFALADQRLRLPATGPTDASHVGNWRSGWWLAQIVRDEAAIATLSATPLEVLRGSSTRADACEYLLVEALQAFHQRAPDWGTKLQAALDATDPEHNKITDEEFVLNILVPDIQMLYYIGIGDIGPFNEALAFALERHKKYWSKGDRKLEPEGFLALGPMAIAGFAVEAGMPIEVSSDYMPLDLIT